TGIDFALELGGSISGTVTDALGTPIAGAYVSANSNTGYGSAASAADGTYTITGLVPGNYVVYASALTCPISPPGGACVTYPTKYYINTYDYNAATLFTARRSSTLTGIDFALEVGGSISGTVTDALGTPIA